MSQRTTSISVSIRRAVVLTILLAAPGCVNGGARMSGKVTLDGVAVPIGSVNVVSQDGKSSDSASINPDGTYTLTNAPLGPVKVSVVVPQQAPPPPPGARPPQTAPDGAKPPDPIADMKKAMEIAGQVPAYYANPEQSGLTFTVEKGSNSYDVQLTRKPGGKK